MMVRALALALLGATLAGCGSSTPRREELPQPQPQASQPAVPASPTERARVHTQLGASYYRIGQFDVALDELKEALDADPKYVPAHNSLGLVYMGLRQDDKAKASFERALRIDRNDSDANNNYGLFLCDRKFEKESVRYFLAAIGNALYKSPWEAYVNAGICTRRGGDEKTAEQYFQKALQLQPNDARALINLAQLYYQQSDLEKSSGALSRYMQIVQAPDASALWLGVRMERLLGDRNAMASYSSQLRSRLQVEMPRALWIKHKADEISASFERGVECGLRRQTAYFDFSGHGWPLPHSMTTVRHAISRARPATLFRTRPRSSAPTIAGTI